jgi:hypothetical protein
MKSKRQERDPAQIEDECLACLAFFAYRTKRTNRSTLIKALAWCTRLDAKVKGSRETWWKFKLDNIHYAFKELEGKEFHGYFLDKTVKVGAISHPTVQINIKKYSLHYFVHNFTLCVELARRALDRPLPSDLERAIFDDATGSAVKTHLSPGDAQALEAASPEGAKRLRQHWHLERDSSLPHKAKEAFLSRHGELFCEACGLRPIPTYGYPLVDAHHRLPLSQYATLGKISTTPADFIMLCPTCHRAVHKHPDCDIEAVKASLPAKGLIYRITP